MPSRSETQRRRIRVNGIVQGVGFRPFVYRLAHDLSLAGFVINDSSGVEIEIEGDLSQLENFRAALEETPPPLARIDSCLWEDIPPTGERRFRIDGSRSDKQAATLISPDIGVCEDCLREMHDPADRRFRYPFTNCTNCGPRFTIVEGVPYDRPKTSMKVFPMCPDCSREYHDPLDRRFHAQPVACPVCGPKLAAHDGTREVAVDDPVAWAVSALREGRILALRGLGGFHLAVDATNDDAVRRLRERKRRQLKPLAMMAPDLDRIQRFCHVSPEEADLSTGMRRPIVLLRRREDDRTIAPSVVYDNRYFGFMLPYTPLHYLLLESGFDALVMTSGNLSEEPIAIANEEALRRLGDIADCFLLHDREILQRCDDSIVRYLSGEMRMIRRARGFVPQPVNLLHDFGESVLAVGPELKNTVALTRGKQVFLSQHIGDLDNPAAFGFFEHCIEHLKTVLEIEPSVIACDLHPEYLSTKWAKSQESLPVVEVQHHHAHLVSVMAERGVEEPTVGIILDGTGYGTDGTIWGGEILMGDARSFRRLHFLDPVGLPGGTAAIREPWRMALSYLRYAYDADSVSARLPLADAVTPENRRIIFQMLDRQLNCPMTSSAGRLFDGVAALTGLCYHNNYEAQAAIALEMAASERTTRLPDSTTRTEVPEGQGPLSFKHLVRGVVEQLESGLPAAEISVRFHTALAELFIAAAKNACVAYTIDRVALSGGVYQNALFLDYMVRRLTAEGLAVLTHSEIPTNDGAVALGQAVIADAVRRDRKPK
jgi:hydrogenase maturation protein HypF